MKTKLLVFLFLILMVGCSQGVKTKASFDLRSISNLGTDIQNIAQNGMVIFGYSDQGDRFAKVMNSADTFNHELDNGTWTFKAISWEDPSVNLSGTASTEKFSGVPNCGMTTVSLTGGDTAISLPLSNAQCELDAFGGVDKTYDQTISIHTKKRFHPLKDIISCKESVDFTTAFSDGSKCNYDLLSYIAGNTSAKDRGYHYSYKIIVRSFYSGAGGVALGENSLESTCLEAIDATSLTTGGLGTVVDYQIPSGEGLAFGIKAYYEDNCAGEAKEYFLKDGLASSGTRIQTANNNIANSERQKLFLKSTPLDVCSNSNPGPSSPFSGGIGTPGLPYLICSPRQLNEIYGTSTPPYMASSFRVLKNLDMNLETDAFYPGETFHGAHGHALNAGKNFKPIGFNEASASGSGLNCLGPGVAPISYTGNFDGGGKTISHLRFEAFEVEDTLASSSESCAVTGLFAQSSGALFADIHFEKVKLENAKRDVGVLVGSATNTRIYNISMKDVSIKTDGATSRIGALAGMVNNSGGREVKKIKVEGLSLEVSGNGNLADIGGAIGKVNQGIVSEIVVKKAMIEARVKNKAFNEALKIGGVIGNFELAVGSLNKIAFYGLVRGSRFVGGIAGRSALSAVSDVMANGLVLGTPEQSSSCATANIGGLFGASGSASLSDALYLGKILFATKTCPDDGTVQKAGSIAGAIGTLTNVYSAHPQASSAGPGVKGTISNENDIRGDTDTSSFFSTEMGTNWSHTPGDYPRLLVDDEQPCAEFLNAAPIGSQTGRGSAGNPYAICSTAQLKEITSGHYELKEDIVFNSSLFTTTISSFHGVLDGKGFNIFAPDKTLISSNTGTIKNINFSGVHLSGPGNVSFIDINSGVIKNARFHGAISGGNDVGMIRVNDSGGLIIGSSFSGDLSTTGTTALVGFITSNEGTIKKSDFNGSLTVPSGFSVFAGIATGKNLSIIDQVKASGHLQISGGADINGSQYAGVVTGSNNASGVISNIFIEGFSGNHNSGAITNNLGFATGVNLGSVSKMVALYSSGSTDRVHGNDGAIGMYNSTEHYIIDGGADSCYSLTTTACGQPIGTLQVNGWDAAPFESTPGVINPVFINYYKALLTGNPLPSISIWEFNNPAGGVADSMSLVSVD